MQNKKYTTSGSYCSLNIKRSFGLACCHYNVRTSKWNILLVKKRYTYCFSSFVFGRYTNSDDVRLKYLFNNMTSQEKLDIISMEFNTLWYKLWLEIPGKKICDIKDIKLKYNNANSVINTCNIINEFKNEDYSIPYKIKDISKLSLYINCKQQFEKNFLHNRDRLKNLINGTKNISLSWEIPKGRRQKGETELNCAIREFEEETRFNINDYKIFFKVSPIKEIINSSNTKYIHEYYIALADRYLEPDNTFKMGKNMSEIETIKWISVDEMNFINKGSELSKMVTDILSYMSSIQI